MQAKNELNLNTGLLLESAKMEWSKKKLRQNYKN
jgi:hypothetical protein